MTFLGVEDNKLLECEKALSEGINLLVDDYDVEPVILCLAKALISTVHILKANDNELGYFVMASWDNSIGTAKANLDKINEPEIKEKCGEVIKWVEEMERTVQEEAANEAKAENEDTEDS